MLGTGVRAAQTLKTAHDEKFRLEVLMRIGLKTRTKNLNNFHYIIANDPRKEDRF